MKGQKEYTISNRRLIKVYRHAIRDYSWEMPKGFVDAGEDSIESAEREFEEETDLYCEKDDIFSLGFVTPGAGILAARIHLFVANQCRRIEPYAANEMGHSIMKFFDATQFLKMARKSINQDPCTLITCYHMFNSKNKTFHKHLESSYEHYISA